CSHSVELVLRPLPVLTRTLRSRSERRPLPWPVGVLGMAPPPPAPFGAVGINERNEYALAQAAVGDPDAISRPLAANGLEDGAAGQDEVGPVAPDAGVGGAPLER